METINIDLLLKNSELINKKYGEKKYICYLPEDKIIETTLTKLDGRIVFCKKSDYKNRIINREDGPAVIKFLLKPKRNNGYLITYKAYYKNDIKHREDGPAVIYYTENGDKMIEEYRYNNFLHRDNGPASIVYNKGKVERKEWYTHGRLSNLNHPSVITYNSDGKATSVAWYYKDNFHRVKGPAFMNQHNVCSYEIMGKILSKSDYYKLIQDVKDNNIKSILDMTSNEFEFYGSIAFHYNKQLYDEIEGAKVMLHMIKNVY